MVQKADSDCYYPETEPDTGDLKSQISKVYERLTVTQMEEADLRRELEQLFAKRQADALAELKRAEKNVADVRAEREQMWRQLTQREHVPKVSLVD